MSTLKERRDVFWKAKAKKFATERDHQAHLRRETEIRLADVAGDRKTILGRFRSTLRWARTWKITARFWRNYGKAHENLSNKQSERIQVIERWARTWKKRAKQCYSRCPAQYEADGDYQTELITRIQKLEDELHNLAEEASSKQGWLVSQAVRHARELLGDRSWYTRTSLQKEKK